MTPAWMSGYVSDVNYTLGFYRELAPSFLNYVCITNGVEGLRVGSKLRYCELGCGRGYGTNLLAAANPDVEFIGIDFNPMHVNEARTLAERSGISNVKFLELSFGEAARSTDPLLAVFDIVALHGVFNWVTPSVRGEIIDFLRAKLVSGGLAYVSYNALPGWAAIVPVQRIFKEFADRATGDSLDRIEKGRAVLKELADKSSGYIAHNPKVKELIQAFDQQDPHYLAHEFLNEGWQPLYVTDVLDSLSEAKLAFVGSAGVAENRLILCVPKDLMALVQSAPDTALRELLKDYAVSKLFRRDVYAKGRLRLTGQELRRRYQGILLALAVVPKQLSEKWTVPCGEIVLKIPFVEAVVSQLRQGPATVADILTLGTKEGFGAEDLLTVIEVLIHNGLLTPCRSDFETVDRSASQRLNNIVFDYALNGDTHRYVAAPLLGSAIGASYFERVAASVLREHHDVNEATAADCMTKSLEADGHLLLREGKLMTRDEVASLFVEFRESGLRHWRNLGVLQ